MLIKTHLPFRKRSAYFICAVFLTPPPAAAHSDLFLGKKCSLTLGPPASSLPSGDLITQENLCRMPCRAAEKQPPCRKANPPPEQKARAERILSFSLLMRRAPHPLPPSAANSQPASERLLLCPCRRAGLLIPSRWLRGRCRERSRENGG